MKTIYPNDLPVPEFHALLQGSVAPRPIAFASTIDREGNVNLSPFSFFNLFSTNPPILIFSPSRRVRDNTTKHTLENILEVPEVVIHTVHFGMVEQMSLASTEYPKGINEFEKAGLTTVQSSLVKPPRILEAKVAFECQVNEVKPLGESGGAGNLVICEVKCAHVDEDILDQNGVIDPNKIDLVARLGGNWYSRTNGHSLFEIPKPLRTMGIGVDQIPDHIRNSLILTGNNLGRLGNVEQLPAVEEVKKFGVNPQLEEMRIRFQHDPASWLDHLHLWAKDELDEGNVEKAWLILLQEQ
ncbi:flavin reductase family protein [Algoriphagus hitonicola]|uniref:NADH-FMN oxidoreductase RutF, flavin reductase (DIM6/NTAB) family n=1 Tax=Algoriphagus hitonicola TaxID=435880 RepID=A0A1I2VDM9_9BACT|nr:flavin reductase family protein [Algoriphagus hitonicola]SFG85526.1 NADH-FMN oxidoreductase RutF, flavin reductase (DIM6/NTAB) family [Algoriphagus hitonicola]